MMNVLTDILCDTSSMMAPQNYKGTLTQNKVIPSLDISSKQEHMHLLDSVSQISTLDRSLPPLNQSSPSSIDIFNSSSQIHIPSNIDSGFEDRNVSVFSDSFPEIVPSWLTHDFMKASDNLPSPDILSNVSDIYSNSRENENLEMLDLGFPPDLASQDNINRQYIEDSQKLLPDLSRFTTNGSLIPSFNDINNSHLHMYVDKADAQYNKFKNNRTDVDGTRNLMNAVLPCENGLLHLPLPSTLNEQCLNSTSSPSVINSQSQSHTQNVVCDKLPQINLNHLDSLLAPESNLSDIQLLRHDFPSVRLEEHTSSTNRSCIDNYNSNRNMMPCEALLNSSVARLPPFKDVSVQTSVTEHKENPVFANCISCSSIPEESPIEIIQCFKCKFCDFVSLHKCAVSSHIDILHSKPAELPVENNIFSSNRNSMQEMRPNESQLHKTNSACLTNTSPLNGNTCIVGSTQSFQCIYCNAVFADLNDHLSCPNNKEDDSHLKFENSYKIIPINTVVISTTSATIGTTDNTKNNISSCKTLSQLEKKSSQVTVKRKILPKKSDDSSKKSDDLSKKNMKKTSTSESNVSNSEKTISSHKKAWQKKMNREMGSYICEFKGCNVRFRALDNLEYHKKCHSSDGNAFACPECGLGFENWGAVAGHLWRIHTNDMELHACDQCPYRTYSLSRLENYHKRIHRDECLYLCDTCGKSFKNGKQLRNHRVIHTGKQQKNKSKSNFKCEICFESYHTRRGLNAHHKSVHNKIKPFVCNYCDYTASKRSTMNMHIRQHTGEKPYTCDVCDYRTADHNSLRRHKMRHSGKKRYECPYCSYSCIQAYTYKDHLKKHPGQNEVFTCNLCSFRTIKHASFSIHMSEHEMNRPQRENSATEISSTDDLFPLAEAMDISLSHGDNLLSSYNKSRNSQSFFNSLMSISQESIN